VLASQGIAKLKMEAIPPVVNAENMAKDKVDTAKQEFTAVKNKVEQTANGNSSNDEAKSDRSANATNNDSSSNSAANESSSNSSSSDENRANRGRESTSTDDSSTSSTASNSDNSQDHNARQDKSDRAFKDVETANSYKHHQTREELKAASWWAFGGTFLSLMAAVLGAMVGPAISVVRHKIPSGPSSNVVAHTSQV
jgi:hypothetical protein